MRLELEFWVRLMSRILIVTLVFFLTGCGEAIFYKHIQYSDSMSDELRVKELILTVSSLLGYSACDNGYCKDGASFSIKQASGNGFELVFFHSFGNYPGPDNKYVSEFSAELSEKCTSCIVKEKESSVWGFVDDSSDWVQISP